MTGSNDGGCLSGIDSDPIVCHHRLTARRSSQRAVSVVSTTSCDRSHLEAQQPPLKLRGP
jgi:hypothetical protein